MFFNIVQTFWKMKEIRIYCLHENMRLHEKIKLNRLAIPFAVTTQFKKEKQKNKSIKKGSIRSNDSKIR